MRPSGIRSDAESPETLSSFMPPAMSPSFTNVPLMTAPRTGDVITAESTGPCCPAAGISGAFSPSLSPASMARLMRGRGIVGSGSDCTEAVLP